MASVVTVVVCHVSKTACVHAHSFVRKLLFVVFVNGYREIGRCSTAEAPESELFERRSVKSHRLVTVCD